MRNAIVAAAVLVVLAIAIPSFLRQRVQWPEHPAIGDIRSMISAQSAYASVNGGFFDRPECLGRPQVCLPGYPADGPPFLDAALASASRRHGYVFGFVLGPGASPDEVARAKGSATSAVSFAYVASPVTPRDGERAFCGDSSGRVCMVAGAMPAVTEGLCPASCPSLR